MQSHYANAVRYDRFTRILHWVVAVVIIYAMCMGYILHALEGTRWFAFFSVLNMSLGTIATPIMLVRFVWRFFRPSLAWPASISLRKKQMVVFIHEVFYLTIFVVLVSGFLMLQKDFHLFGLLPISRPIDVPVINHFFFVIHRYSCIMLGTILLMHVAAVLKYTFSGKPEILRRML
ncbi:cytochrome b [Serratia quinivorans]|uniref:cytochrome b n=1 Tax=Serratia quinivorans TaxID=137545 RepID=UPI0021B7EE72|nr:cytochrome b/b6 domain-containing protein [Serratia quinivorans]